jgi:predicted nucleotide-binding protein (sugar kinase/HSP70/actin superfamily)
MRSQSSVGIPRALSYYTFYPMWREFFEALGLKVVVSLPTNRKFLDDGIRETVNDACIPIKVFHGHVLNLAERVDYIFIPRMVSADGKSTFCPKFLGLPDMVRHAGMPLPQLIDVRFNCGRFPGGILQFFFAVAFSMGIKNPITIFQAAIRAVLKDHQYRKLLQMGLTPLKALAMLDQNPGNKYDLVQRDNSEEKHKMAIALLGYPYAVFDPYISADIYEKLLKLGVSVITFEQIPPKIMRQFSRVLPQNFFWYYSNRVCWAGLYLLRAKNKVDGIIHLTAFGCGPDAMVDKTLELEAKQAGLPFLSLSIDEHTGEGGVQTRLEAFIDLLQARKSKIKVAGY